MSEAETSPYSATVVADEIAFLAEGRETALADLFSQYRGKLERMVEYRLDRRLCGRVDAADVLQEAYLEASRRINDYLADPTVSFFVWVTQITRQSLLMVHRRHLGQKRDAGQDVPLHGRENTYGASLSLAEQLAARWTSPTQAAIREENLAKLRTAIDGMDQTDREILTLRHFKQLSNSEVSEILGLKKTAASNRYVRALKRLKEIMKVVTNES